MEKIKDYIKAARAWIGPDGAKHAVVSLLLIMALGWIRPLYIPVILVAFVGFCKECWDLTHNGARVWRDSLHDLACDFVGICAGLLLVFLNCLG